MKTALLLAANMAHVEYLRLACQAERLEWRWASRSGSKWLKILAEQKRKEAVSFRLKSDSLRVLAYRMAE
jgi:hypothetical protein